MKRMLWYVLCFVIGFMLRWAGEVLYPANDLPKYEYSYTVSGDFLYDLKYCDCCRKGDGTIVIKEGCCTIDMDRCEPCKEDE